MPRVIEMRRHSYTKKGKGRGKGSHLSFEGVRLAREVGSGCGPFSRVFASDVPRTVETALAMGFAVDEVIGFPMECEWDAVIAEIGWHVLWEVEEPFAYLRRVLPDRPETRRMAEWYAAAWSSLAAEMADGEVALVVTHGLISEAGLVACFPDAGHEGWGPAFSHLEGARMVFEAGQFTSVELLRLPRPLFA